MIYMMDDYLGIDKRSLVYFYGQKETLCCFLLLPLPCTSFTVLSF